jgi:Predicted kinase
MKRQCTITVMIGVPGSGKSYWCREYMKGHPDTVRTNKDELRAMLHNGVHSKGKENEVIAVRDFIIEQSLSIGKDILVDDTNFHEKHLIKIQEIAAKFNAIVEIKDFTHVPLETCLEQNLKRPHPVRERVIRSMYNQYVKPKHTLPIYNPERPNALIADLDGTLALFDRKTVNAYDRDFTKDDLNRALYTLLHRYANDTTIFILSGRQEKDRDATTTWLKENIVPYDFLYMRQTDDKRSDYIVKQEIYNEHIKDRYGVIAVFDDRLQVCRLWYELGLPLFRVGDPDSDF